MLTTFEGEELTFRALRAGAAGYLLKDAGGARLVAAVEAVAAGEMPAGAGGGGPAGRVLRAAAAGGAGRPGAGSTR